MNVASEEKRAQRIDAVKLLDAGLSAEKIAKQFGVRPQTVYNWKQLVKADQRQAVVVAESYKPVPIPLPDISRIDALVRRLESDEDIGGDVSLEELRHANSIIKAKAISAETKMRNQRMDIERGKYVERKNVAMFLGKLQGVLQRYGFLDKGFQEKIIAQTIEGATLACQIQHDLIFTSVNELLTAFQRENGDLYLRRLNEHTAG